MKFLLLNIILFYSYVVAAQKKISVLSFGIDYRLYPIDIEDVPRGPLPDNNGLPSDDGRFWQAVSIQGRYGIRFEKNWLISASLYTRYNLLHRLEGVRYPNPAFKQVKEKKNLKFDIFLDLEKKIRLKKEKERYFWGVAGLGFTNINSRFDIILTDTSEYGPFPEHHYKGTMLHFGPRLSFGYQYENIKASLDTYLIEDPALTNLTSLWFGATICYEISIKRKK